MATPGKVTNRHWSGGSQRLSKTHAGKSQQVQKAYRECTRAAKAEGRNGE